MRTSRPPRGGGLPAALPALLRATHFLGLALGAALGRLRDSGVTAAKMFERAEESALLLRMTREAAAILGARWDKLPERHRPHYVPEQRFRILRIRSFLGLSQPLVAGRVKARWICRSSSTTSMRSGCCQCSFEKQPEGRSLGENASRRVRARRHRGGRDTGLCTPAPAAIPIAPLQRRAIPIAPIVFGASSQPAPSSR